MADSFSFESGKQFNKKNFSFGYHAQHDFQDENINKLIKFFDKDNDGKLSNNRGYYDKKSEASSIFKLIKKYIKDDGIFDDKEIALFLKEHKEIADISVKDFKIFINGETSSTTMNSGTKTLPIKIKTKDKNFDLVETNVLEEVPTTTKIKKTDYFETEETFLVNYPNNEKLYSKTVNYDKNNSISNITEEKYEYNMEKYENSKYIYTELNSKILTSTDYENGKISQVTEKKYENRKANLVEEKISYYTDGVLTSATRTQYVNGKTIVEDIFYEEDFPVEINKYVDGEYVSTSILEKGHIPIEIALENGQKDVLQLNCTSIYTQNINGTTSETIASEVDKNGSYTPENFLQKKITNDNNITIVEKFAINESSEENRTSKTVGYQLIETVANIDGTLVQNTYNSDNIFDYEEKKVFLTSQSYIKDDKINTCFYDGQGNTYVVLQNGDCASKIEASFKVDQTKDDFWHKFYQLNVQISDESTYKYFSPEDFEYIVGENVLVPGEFSSDSEVIANRNSAAQEIEKYNEWYFDEILKNIVTTNYEAYTLKKSYNNVYELAKDLLENKFNLKYVTSEQINNYANEILSLNGGNLKAEKLKENNELLITNFKRINNETRKKLEELGIPANDNKNHFFFTHFEKLSIQEEQKILNYIEKYRSENNVSGDFDSETFEDLKTKILEEKGICLTDSGLYIENNANFWHEILSLEQKDKYNNKKISLETFIKDIGLDYTIPDSDGEKLYNLLRIFDQKYLAAIPFGMLIEEVAKCRQNNTEITCDLIIDLVEQITLYRASIRVVDGKIDNKTIEQRKKEIQTNPPEIVQSILQKTFEKAFEVSKKELSSVDKQTAWYQDVCNWCAERIESCGGDTDNRKDVLQAQNAEERLIKLLSSNPAQAFKGLTGYDLTYENIEKLLNGELNLKSLECISDYNENLAEYKAWAKAIVISAVSIIANSLCPIGNFATANLVGKFGNYAINLAKSATITGTASVTYDVISGEQNINYYESFMEGFTISSVMCLGNATGSLIMKGILPKSITSGTATCFKSLSFGNVYTANSTLANAGCYILESAFQNCAISGLAGRNMANLDEYKFCILAGSAAIKIDKFIKSGSRATKINTLIKTNSAKNFATTTNITSKIANNIDNGNMIVKTLDITQDGINAVAKAIDRIPHGLKNALTITVGSTLINIVRDGAIFILRENIDYIGDSLANTQDLNESISKKLKSDLKDKKTSNIKTFQEKDDLLKYLSSLEQNFIYHDHDLST